MYNGLRFSVKLVILLFTIQSVNSQVGRNHVKPLLSGSDQKIYEKIEVIFNKAKSTENEANSISTGTTNKEKNKYLLKRMEAAQLYEKANRELANLFKDKLSEFRKKNKNVEIAVSIKNKEETAHELFRKAKTVRKAADGLIYPHEKLEKIIEAEETESQSIDIFSKVLYACLNHPVAYDVLLSVQINPDEKNQLTSKKKEPNKSPEITYIPVESEVSPIINPLPVAQKDTIKKTELKGSNSTSSLYDLVNVNENQVDKFNRFLETSYPSEYESYIINFGDLNYREIDSLKAAWYRYSQAKFTPEDIASLRKSGVKDNTVLIAEANAKNNYEKEKDSVSTEVNKKNKNFQKSTEPDQSGYLTSNSGGKIGSDVSAEVKSKTNPPSGKNETEKISVNKTNILAEKTTIPVSNTLIEGFIYKVQISASRIPLNAESLKNIYDGNQIISELYEENWYKYAIGEYSTYNEAKKLKEKVNIPGAFIIAYLNGKRIQVLKNTSDGREFPINRVENLHYKVQIAASKTTLDANYLKHIYSGSEKIEVMYDEGWYKYLINTGSSVEDAIAFIQNENIPGAFIVSFLGDKKIELAEAIRLSKNR